MRLLKAALVAVACLCLLALYANGYLLSARCPPGVAAPVVSWPTAALLPPPPPPLATSHAQNDGCDRVKKYLLRTEALPAGLPGSAGEPLHLTFATSSVDELLTNWARHVRRLGLPAVVSAMDPFVLAKCSRLKVHCLASFDPRMDALLRSEAARNGQTDASHVNIRGNPTLFISLGARKVQSILTILDCSGRPVLVSDVDVVWMGDPRPLVLGLTPGYEDFAHADVLASTDCLDPMLDVKDHGCFHTLQDRNTGVLMVRNTTAGRAMMHEWKARTAGAFEAWETDQTAFDDLLRGRGRGHRRNMTHAQRIEYLNMKRRWCNLPPSTPEDATMGQQSDLGGLATAGSRRLFDVCIPHVSRALHFGLLPLALIANGHTFFVQQLQLQNGIWPYAVHATYQFEDTVDCAFGKRERMREWGLWLGDEDDGGDEEEHGCVIDYDGLATTAGAKPFSSPRTERRLRAAKERFLVLLEDPPTEPAAAWSIDDPHARGRQHVAHLEAFRQRLADGVLLARALQRTVVLPPFYCYCDKYWARLTRCTIGHQALATQPLPFRCPMDHVAPIGNWHGTVHKRKNRERCALPASPDGPPDEGMPFRTHAWLQTPSAQPHRVGSSATLVPADFREAARDHSTSAQKEAQLARIRHRAAVLVPQHGADLINGPSLALPRNSSPTALQARAGNATLLRVQTADSRRILGCVPNEAEANVLLERLFRTKWCWRPEEMTEPRVNKTTGETIDVCVWSPPTPKAPPQCGH